jgi:hypothetical protein
MTYPANTLESIYQKIDSIVPDEYGCKNWTRCNAQVRLNHKVIRVSHIALERKLKRPLKPGYCALHTCDWASCVNEDHLYEGTKKDNAQDREKRNPGCHYNNHSPKLKAWRESQELYEHLKRIGNEGRRVRWNQNTNTKK